MIKEITATYLHKSAMGRQVFKTAEVPAVYIPNTRAVREAAPTKGAEYRITALFKEPYLAYKVISIEKN